MIVVAGEKRRRFTIRGLHLQADHVAVEGHRASYIGHTKIVVTDGGLLDGHVCRWVFLCHLYHPSRKL